MINKKILYIDMDGVIVDFDSGINKLSQDDKEKYINDTVEKITEKGCNGARLLPKGARDFKRISGKIHGG